MVATVHGILGQGQPLALLRDPGHRFALDVTLQGVAAVSSPTHALDVHSGEEGLRVRLKEGEALPDRDCLLTWRPPQEELPEYGVVAADVVRSLWIEVDALAELPCFPAVSPGWDAAPRHNALPRTSAGDRGA